MITVMVCGATGKMGREVIKAVHNDPELQFVGGIDPKQAGEDAGTAAGIEALGLPLYETLTAALADKKPDVIVDFTSPAIILKTPK